MNRYLIIVGLFLVITTCSIYMIYVWSNHLSLSEKASYSLERQKLCYERGDIYKKENPESITRYAYDQKKDVCIAESADLHNDFIIDLFQGGKTIAHVILQNPNPEACTNYLRLANEYFGESMASECQ